jgi:transposase
VQADSTTYVGLDVHKRTVAVAVLLPGRAEPVEWQETNDATVARRLARRILREASGPVVCCYEAGPTGYVLQRRLRAEKVMCQVVAPSLIPVQPGSRVKTDRKDARKLAGLLRAGLLTEVHPPSEEQEALRDLCRCREDLRDDLLRARHRMGKFLLRRHCVYNASKSHWGTRHMQWLRCFRGIDMVTAVSLIAEVHDFRRFPSARALMAYFGLVPRECSSGEKERRGSITKAGNGHVRRYLVEAAWHNRNRPAIGLPLRQRRQKQPAWVLAIADRAQERLHRRWVRMTFKGKPTQKTVVAMAREMVGYIWAILCRQPETVTVE